MNPNFYSPRRTVARWADMPNVTPRARRFATQALAPVGGALTRASAEMVVIHFHGVDGRRRKVSATIWKPHEEGYRLEGGTVINQAILSEIAGALNETVRELAALWPDNARPHTIGLAVDGNAIVFNASYPGAEGTAWLDEHLSGRAPAAILHNAGGEGLLTRLCQLDRPGAL